MQTLTYSLLVLGAPHQGGAYSALRFAEALADAGQTLYRVFFLDDGVLAGSANAVAAQDGLDLHARWGALHARCGVDLVLCVSSALRRGLLDDGEARRYGKSVSVAAPFAISGLGQLVDACIASDRVVSFG
ncbi:MAG TPA: sulfurtransferase complex subunit TusD [Spongiibacteraceae bacterium]|nr:sulfurtransferase complex subunit TusD [Spongiibacteraceae bacterium]